MIYYQLSSCPFCGCNIDPKIERCSTDVPFFYALCDNCCARGPLARNSYQAGVLWRSRQTPDQPQGSHVKEEKT